MLYIREKINLFIVARQLVEKGKIDFLVMDYLSEITMSLLVAAQKKNPVVMVPLRY